MNRELLERVEKLEQAIQEIWASCSCLSIDREPEEFEIPNCEPFGDDFKEPERPEEEQDHE